MMFLSPDELVELTEYKRPCDQIRWLKSNAYIFEISGKGHPKVLRRLIESRLDTRSAGAVPRLRLA